MGFLRTLFWIAATVVVVVFSIRNWSPVTILLFGGLQADVKLPVLLGLAFLLGFGPLYLWHRVTRWQAAKRIGAAERAIPAAVSHEPEPVAGDY